MALTWQKTPPSEPGWWWMRWRWKIDGYSDWDRRPECVYQDEYGFLRIGDRGAVGYPQTKPDIEWAGPIPAPEEPA